MASNRVELQGRVEAVEPMRMSPAGVASVRFTVRHESVLEEASMPRRVEVAMTIVALGALAEQARQLESGVQVRVEGFLARASLKSEWPVIHIETLQIF
ncbi:MAG: primosomal replication protein N [Betaproteobacteria bacterium]